MIHEDPLVSRVEKLHSGTESVHDYLTELKERIDTIEPKIEALLAETGRWERLAKRAETLGDRYPEPARRPPLYGVPIGVKDIFHVDGFQTRAGSQLPAAALTGSEAAVVTRLREVGGVVLGKTVTTEFAYFEPGPTHNPHDLDRTPGGSSSGSAAAVASGLCPAALGTQTIGSIIRPAAFCGIVGFKPTSGRFPTDGVIPLSETADTVGVFTQDTAGADLLASVLADQWRVRPQPTDDPTIGVPKGPYLEQASKTALTAFEEQLEDLAAAGYEIKRIKALDEIDTINTRHDRLVAAEAALAHEKWYETYREQYADSTRSLIESGCDTSVSELLEARHSCRETRTTLMSTMDNYGVDLCVAPAAPGPAPMGLDSTGAPVMNVPWTHAGVPTLTLPAGTTNDGLPLGLQIAGRFGADETLLQWSHDIASAL